MNEMQLLEEFRAAVAPPDPETLTRARARVLGSTADGHASRRARWPRLPGSWPKLALTGLAATTMAAAVAVTLAVPGGAPAHPGAATPFAKELAYRVADVAAARPYVRPGQWVYIKEKTINIVREWDIPGVDHSGWDQECGDRLTGPHKGKWFFMPCPPWAKGRHGSCQAMDGRARRACAHAGNLCRPEIVATQPGRARPLPGQASAARRAPGLARPRRPYREFDIISALLFTYVMPPALTAELYRALGDIPGVTVDRHAVDVAGRNGIGFQITAPRIQNAAGVVVQLILNPKTYDVMGQQSFDTEQRRSLGPRHVVRERHPENRPGLRPRHTALTTGPARGQGAGWGRRWPGTPLAARPGRSGDSHGRGPAVHLPPGLHPGNVLVEASGELAVLDWDDAGQACPDRSLPGC